MSRFPISSRFSHTASNDSIRPVAFLLNLIIGIAVLGGQAFAEEAALTQKDGGLKGYISMNIPAPKPGYGYGVSFYVTAWPLVDKPLAGLQIGLPGTWLIPDNRDANGPLAPVGTMARDQWPERGPTWGDVFQTIEGSLGYWCSTQYGTPLAKFRMNGTPDGYNTEIASPGWGFNSTKALSRDKLGIVQLSNRLVVPPDGFPLKVGTCGQVFGYAWMALPLTDAVPKKSDTDTPTGDQSWTLFLNTTNFKGPVAFWAPWTWSRISKGYHFDDGRGLDARPAIVNGGAIEIGAVPLLEAHAKDGTLFSRIPRLQFPVDAKGRTVLMQDVTVYSKDALANRLGSWLKGGPPAAGTFDPQGGYHPACSINPISLRQGEANHKIVGFEKLVSTAMMGTSTYGLQWQNVSGMGYLPEYFKQKGDSLIPVPEAEVPTETHLNRYTFPPPGEGNDYTSPVGPDSLWVHPGPAAGPFQALLSDGSKISYAWYRFIDQPSVLALGLDNATRDRLQTMAIHTHHAWRIDANYLPPPTQGDLATLDDAILVTPPSGLEEGYVPIVIRQQLLHHAE